MNEKSQLTALTKQQVLARSVVGQMTDTEVDMFLKWGDEYLSVMQSNLSRREKAKQIWDTTRDNDIVKLATGLMWKQAKASSKVAKRKHDAFFKGRPNLRVGTYVGLGTMAVMGGSGAGIAAGGTAIGLPLALVTGVGAAGVRSMIAEARQRQSETDVTYFVPLDDDQG